MELMDNKCFFLGQQRSSEKIMPYLEEAIRRHITDYKVDRFFVGDNCQFDKLAAQAIINARRDFPNIELNMVIPYHPILKKPHLPFGFDSLYYPFKDLIMLQEPVEPANRRMIMRCYYLISNAGIDADEMAEELMQFARERSSYGLLHIDDLTVQHSPK